MSSLLRFNYFKSRSRHLVHWLNVPSKVRKRSAVKVIWSPSFGRWKLSYSNNPLNTTRQANSASCASWKLTTGERKAKLIWTKWARAERISKAHFRRAARFRPPQSTPGFTLRLHSVKMFLHRQLMHGEIILRFDEAMSLDYSNIIENYHVIACNWIWSSSTWTNSIEWLLGYGPFYKLHVSLRQNLLWFSLLTSNLHARYLPSSHCVMDLWH